MEIERVPRIVPADNLALLALARGNWEIAFRNPVRRPKTGSIIGYEQWRDTFKNLVVNQGLDDLLDVTLSGATQDTTWFILLTGTTPTPAAADTLASHGGWTEFTNYDEVNRQAWTDGGVSGQSVDNSASPAQFTISSDSQTIGGAGMAGVNTGTAGRLYAVGAFSGGDVVLNTGATIDITATFTMAAA